jgi:hypothetical protein
MYSRCCSSLYSFRSVTIISILALLVAKYENVLEQVQARAEYCTN